MNSHPPEDLPQRHEEREASSGAQNREYGRPLWPTMSRVSPIDSQIMPRM